ncbi:MAG: thiamine pyrophosphate-binding protein [Acidobacteria bacterium]|nr:MAG: thiamine pyrophosphate-binding protein [Acidobacteriota bacterium]PYQ86395.1 MAG: thiamine pyrophosphate-binding protein [Acidobacteriota bacterium]PYR07425.1 MAG: thiamine pyrophosphate-binding protein [Acidobacteriota bacterium]
MANARENPLGRRRFLKGAAASAAALVAKSASISAQPQEAGTPRTSPAAPPNAQLAADTEPPPRRAASRIVERPGSDFMVDVIKTLGFEYVAANPGSSFEGLHESIINYGDNKLPELLTCCHEESSVAMAHGYAKIEGKPMLAVVHGNIGLQHASMAIYNAYADRVPVVVIAGNWRDAGTRANGVNSYHSAQDMALIVRDYVKWDDEPASLTAFAESAVRAYKIAMTPPMEPVLLVIDHDVQLRAMGDARPGIPRLTMPSPPAGEPGAVREAARLLVAAENPRINAGRAARTPNGIALLVELAELLQAPVNGGGDRVNFPSRHPLAGNGSGAGDVILNLEVQGGGGPGFAGGARAANAKTINISSLELYIKSNLQDFQHLPDADLIIAADAEATLPALVEEVKRQLTADRKRALQERGKTIADAHHQARVAAAEAAAYGWESSPISLARLSAELWAQIEREDWSLVSWQGFVSGWPGRLWNFDKHYQYIGGQGAGAMGYGAPAAVGAALANRKHGRLSVNIQTDGDLNYAPGVLWTACHHKIPLLTVMHNNRAYHQEVMFIQQMASQRNRGGDRAHIGTTLRDPNIDYAKMAQAYGMFGEGPIADPKALAPAITRALDRVKRGEPALLDVITQPR